MKNTKKKSYRNHPAYPNAASRDYFLEKALNAATAVVSGMGIMTVLVFFFLL